MFEHQFGCILPHGGPSSQWKIDSPIFFRSQGGCHSWLWFSQSSWLDYTRAECVTVIEDQYNFCIKRADLRQKCAPEKSLELHKWSGGWGRPSWNVLRLQHTGHHKCKNWSGFHVSQTSWWLVQVGLGCREEEGWRGNCRARGSSKDGFRGRQLSPVFCIAVGVNLSNICSYVFGNPK